MEVLFGFGFVLGYALAFLGIFLLGPEQKKKVGIVLIAGAVICLCTAAWSCLHTEPFSRNIQGVQIEGIMSICTIRGTLHNTNDYAVTVSRVTLTSSVFSAGRIVKRWTTTLQPGDIRKFELPARDYLQIARNGDVIALYPAKALRARGE